jgi:lactobin A/cerein 7B family class IIb bacteriocin
MVMSEFNFKITILEVLDMRELTTKEIEEVNGGIPWAAPVLVALADTGSLGPLVFAFSAGYAVGGWAYRHWLAEL